MWSNDNLPFFFEKVPLIATSIHSRMISRHSALLTNASRRNNRLGLWTLYFITLNSHRSPSSELVEANLTSHEEGVLCLWANVKATVSDASSAQVKENQQIEACVCVCARNRTVLCMCVCVIGLANYRKHVWTLQNMTATSPLSLPPNHPRPNASQTNSGLSPAWKSY